LHALDLGSNFLDSCHCSSRVPLSQANKGIRMCRAF
jgi:hypothetical protein